MDKNAIKKFAIWARRELISRVSQKALQYGISAEEHGNPDADNVNGRILTPVEQQQRRSLISKIEAEGYEQAMEEAAYTWFNRFHGAALHGGQRLSAEPCARVHQ